MKRRGFWMDTILDIYRNLDVVSSLLNINTPHFKHLIRMYEMDLNIEHLNAIFNIIECKLDKFDFLKGCSELEGYNSKFRAGQMESRFEFNEYLRILIRKLKEGIKFTFDVSLLEQLCEWPILNSFLEKLSDNLTVMEFKRIVNEIHRIICLYSMKYDCKKIFSLNTIAEEVHLSLYKVNIDSVNEKLKQFCFVAAEVLHECEVSYVKRLGPNSQTILTLPQLDIYKQIYGIKNKTTLSNEQLELLETVESDRKRNLRVGITCSILGLLLVLEAFLLPYIDPSNTENNKKDEMNPIDGNSNVSQIDESFETAQKVADGLLEVERVKRISLHK